MSVDAGGPIRRRRPRDIWRLPEIVDLRVLRRHYELPRRVTIRGVDRRLEEAVEVVVTLSEPLVIRALGPVLWVGDEPLTIAEGDQPTEYRFVAPDERALVPGAPVSLSWNASGAPRRETKFRYEPPEDHERLTGREGLER